VFSPGIFEDPFGKENQVTQQDSNYKISPPKKYRARNYASKL
jgi:hypothetical protein